MTGSAERLRAAARRLVDRSGTPMTLRHRLTTTYDPSVGSVVESWADIATVGVLEESDARRSPTLAHTSDRTVLLAAATMEVEPAPGDRLTIDTVEHTVVEIETSYVGAAPVLHRLRLRR